MDNAIHLIEEQIQPSHITLNEYEDTLELHQVFEDEKESPTHNKLYHISQVEPKKKYDVRPRLSREK